MMFGNFIDLCDKFFIQMLRTIDPDQALTTAIRIEHR